MLLILAACASPTPAPPQVPTQAPPNAPSIEQPIATFCNNVDPSQFTMNTLGLPYSWQANCVKATPYDKTQPPGPTGLPEHMEINFGAVNPAAQQPNDPVMYLIPKEEYVALWANAGDTTIAKRMGQLETIVAQKGAGMPSSGMPVLPMEKAPATNDLAVQGKYLDFGGWDGVRFVGRFSQGPNAVTSTNPQLFYIFQGFAGSDDQYFVAFFYPVTTPFLPVDASGVPAAEMQSLNTDPNAYMQERIKFLNGLNDAAWVPNLSVLDAVLASIEYTGASGSQPIPTVMPPTAAPQTPYGQVTAPAGVNVRTGPGTNYPVLGTAPFNTTLSITGKSVDGQWWVTPIQGAPNNQGWVSASYVQAFNVASVPVVQAPPPPPPPTATPAPPPTAQPQIGFWADRTTIMQGECTALRWQVYNVQAVWVYPAGEDYKKYPVTGEGSRQVCPPVTTTYEMRVQKADGSTETRQVTINVLPGNPLANTSWMLQSMYGNQVPVPGSALTIYFSSGNTTSGSGGCNQFSGTYAVNGRGLYIGPLTSTGALCSDALNAQEQTYLQVLQTVSTFELAGNQLILRNASGQEIARYNRVVATPATGG